MTRRSKSRGRATGVAVAAGALAWIAGPAVAPAQTLQEALAQAYATNPTLAAALAGLNATNEEIPEALSTIRPTVSVTGDAGVTYTSTEFEDGAFGSDALFGADDDDDDSESETITPASIGISVSQPIYQGGETFAELREAENNIQTERATVVDTEQDILLETVTAYLDVVEAQAVLELEINNEQVLRRQLEAAQDRFNVGEVTRTDVAQAEAGVAGAVAGRIVAEGELRDTRSEFERVVGIPPGSLQAPPAPPGLPTSLEETIALAAANNPNIIAVQFSERAALAAVDVARAGLLPDVSITGSVTRDVEPSTTVSSQSTAQVTAQVTVPLYQAGLVTSNVRAAKHVANEVRILVEETRRDVVDAAVAAWVDLTTARATIESLLSEVRANEIALDGVEQEALVGARTVLDILDAQTVLLDSQVDLVTAQRDELVAAYEVLASVGRLTARALNLPVDYYEFDVSYDRTRSRIWGTSIEDSR